MFEFGKLASVKDVGAQFVARVVAGLVARIVMVFVSGFNALSVLRAGARVALRASSRVALRASTLSAPRRSLLSAPRRSLLSAPRASALSAPRAIRPLAVVTVAIVTVALSIGVSASAVAQGAESAGGRSGGDAEHSVSASSPALTLADTRGDAKQDKFVVPALTSAVMDDANVIAPQTLAQLENAIRYLREQGGAQITVLTVPTLGGLSIEEAAIKVTDQWKLGTKRTDDGVLFIIAPHERRMRIEVGRGLQGDLTDVISHRIIEDSVTPLFKSGELDSGIVVGVYKIAQVTNPNIKLDGQLDRHQEVGDANGKSKSVIILLAFIFMVIWFLSASGGGSGRGGRGGGPNFWGGFGGGGGGFGGGGFGGGGGSSGGWGGGGGGFSGGGSSGGW